MIGKRLNTPVNVCTIYLPVSYLHVRSGILLLVVPNRRAATAAAAAALLLALPLLFLLLLFRLFLLLRRLLLSLPSVSVRACRLTPPPLLLLLLLDPLTRRFLLGGRGRNLPLLQSQRNLGAAPARIRLVLAGGLHDLELVLETAAVSEVVAGVLRVLSLGIGRFGCV